jgi:predicted RNA-binding Zn-ribbon protein involved in translation (DUF1610 family)
MSKAKEAEEKRQEGFLRLQNLLSPLENYLDTHPERTMMEFDYDTVHDLTLFTVEPNFDFEGLKKMDERIQLAMPAIKRIFAKPIINLTDASDVLPIENVHRINQATILNLANHSENASDITSRGVKPRRLLTEIYEDNYGLYENIIFCNLIDALLKYIRQSIASLKDMVYAKEVMEFNLLERSNHLNYFLTIGKLHTGYIRDFDQYYSLSEALYSQLRGFENIIEARLSRPVYQKNKIRNKRLPLKKTNIFLMQKDYHQVYVLYKKLWEKKIISLDEEPAIDVEKLRKNYFDFVEMLSLFAIAQFDFEADPSFKEDFRHLNSDFSFKHWKLNLQAFQEDGLLIALQKEKSYRLLLLPSLEGELTPAQETLEKEIGAEENIVCQSFEEEELYPKSCLISLENIESFRRIQQCVLRAMIYADGERKDCPFCSGKLVHHPKEDTYECPNCHTLIGQETCPSTGQTYFWSDIASFRKQEINLAAFGKGEEWLFNRKVESSLFYRNITKITPQGEFVCPHCGEVHRPKR